MPESWEDLVLPVLRIAKSHKETDLHRLIAAIKLWRGERERDPNTPLGGMVGSAFAALLHSELLVSGQKGRCHVTAAGLRILEDPPPRLDRSFLETIPQYRAYWETHRRDRQAREFQRRRLEYYASGRRLFFHGAWQPALTLLAYAIEFHLKSPLAAIEDWLKLNGDYKHLYRHNLPTLYRIARKYGFFKDCEINSDLLSYAGDMFNLRYPRGEAELLQRRRGYRVGHFDIFSYDDCIMQLDEALSSDFGDPTLSMGVAVAGIPQLPISNLLESFFHCNPFALSRLGSYREVVEERKLRTRLKLPVSPEAGFVSAGLPHPGFSLARYNRLLEVKLAKNFRLPEPGEPNPDPAAVLLSSRVSHPSNIRWILDRLSKEFGDHRVAVRRDSQTGDLEAFVFCRSASDWWRALTLERDRRPLWHGSGTVGEPEKLEKWIDETKAQFKGSNKKG